MVMLGGEDALVELRTLPIEPANPYARPNTEEAAGNDESGDESSRKKFAESRYAHIATAVDGTPALNRVRSAFAGAHRRRRSNSARARRCNE
jgi:hypothetical protein